MQTNQVLAKQMQYHASYVHIAALNAFLFKHSFVFNPTLVQSWH